MLLVVVAITKHVENSKVLKYLIVEIDMKMYGVQKRAFKK